MRRAVVCALAMAAAACGGAPDNSTPAPAHGEKTAEVRQLGSWSGTGSTTLGFVSESGSFRITWKAQNTDNTHPGSFQLTLRSGISGRPLTVIADHQGAGGGSVEFGDDPRMYEFLVESKGIGWSIAVDETFAGKRQD